MRRTKKNRGQIICLGVQKDPFSKQHLGLLFSLARKNISTVKILQIRKQTKTKHGEIT